jgi:hypothetical protein
MSGDVRTPVSAKMGPEKVSAGAGAGALQSVGRPDVPLARLEGTTMAIFHARILGFADEPRYRVAKI